MIKARLHLMMKRFFKKREIRACINLRSVQLLSRVRPFVTPWTAARLASLSITNSRSLLKLVSI